ncbi:MAG: pyrroline-5-carboxylate reductase [Pseudomonadota bacterium]
MSSHVAFIGGGNMALAIVGGLLQSGHPANHIRVADPSEGRRQIAGQLGDLGLYTDNLAAVRGADIVLLAVKPHLIEPVCDALKDVVQTDRPLVMSVAAGVTTATMSDALGGYERIVRIMPNTPALVRRGTSGLYAGRGVSDDDRRRSEALVGAFGRAIWVDTEDGLHDVTAISGSGPAYFFLFMEYLENEARALGLSDDEAALLVRETAAGAAAMALDTDVSLEELRRRVTSPGGTTQAAIAAYQAAGFEQAVHNAVSAARRRSVELAAPTNDTNNKDG